MDALYETIGSKLKHVFTGYNAWIIGYRDEYFRKIGLSASEKIPLYNGALECELREYVIFDGDKKSFMAGGGRIKESRPDEDRRDNNERRASGKERRSERKSGEFKSGERKFGERKFGERKFGDRKFGDRRFDDRPDNRVRTELPIDPENPFAVRRNPHALKSIGDKKPSLPPQAGPVMRSRGWKKRDSDNNENK